MRFIDITCIEYTRIYDIHIFSYPDLVVILEIYILSRSHKLADVDPSGTLDSCSGTKTNRKIHIILWLRQK